MPLGAGIGAAGDRYVLTAAHIIAGCRRISMACGGVRHPALLVGLDSRLDLALIEDEAMGAQAHGAGSPLAAAIAGQVNLPRQQRLHGIGFGQPGHGDDDPIRVELHSPGLQEGVTDRPLLALTGPLLPGTSGSPVMTQDGVAVGMVIGLLRTDRSRGVALPGPDILRFLSCFGLQAPSGLQHRPAAQGVLVRCVA